MSIENQSNNNNDIDLKYLLQYDNCVHSVKINDSYFDSDNYEFFQNLLCLCSYVDSKNSIELDKTFNTLVDETINAETLIKELIKNHSLKCYIVDSLKRYNSLLDIIHILPSCANFQQKNETKIPSFFQIIDSITKSILLTTTINSMSYESQRYFGNFIQKNDLPLPFTYYMWNQQNKCLEYKINFNILAETMCLTNGQYVLQIGSQSTIGLGKTSLLQFIFPDKRLETLTTDGSSNIRNGCIDVLFSFNNENKKKESFIIFDVHGTINAYNEDIITAIQHYSSFQILYITKEDLNSGFLESMMNYSKFTREKPTIIIIFDSDYDDKQYQAEKTINSFQTKYKDSKHIKWLTAPPEILWNQRHNNKTNKDLSRSQRLIESFNGVIENFKEETKKQICCTSIFSIQYHYLSLSKSNKFIHPTNYNYELQNQLNRLFSQLNDTTDNLQTVTPVSYLDSAIRQCDKELTENWDGPQKEIQERKQKLVEERSKINMISPYPRFFIELLIKRSYIELLITEKYLEKWRSQFESTLHKNLTIAKNEALKFSSQIKRFEEQLEIDKNLNQQQKNVIKQKIDGVKSEYNKQRILVNNINQQLMNVDLTIGLFCDEIMALYELSPILFNSKTLIADIGKSLINLMFKGFAIHILRGRPLRCHSKLIEESIKFIEKTQEQPPLVLTVIGEQSSAKSSLMNTTFGCNFRVSSGRCTIGMYMTVIHWKSRPIIIFDTEGLLSLEESGSIFDNQMVTMAILSSHVVLINHKGEFNSNLKDLIGMSFYAKLNIKTPIKPKLLFVLRDQADLSSKEVFFKQLTELKEQLQNDSQFLKSSIDDELDIHHENLYLLPNAFSHEINAISGLTQQWRTQLFPNEILKLRDIIFENISNVKGSQRNSLVRHNPSQGSDPVTPTIEPAYTNMKHLYEKIASNWDAIDRLGPKLLQCKTLHELSILEELKKIADNVITNINVTVYNNGATLITQTLLPFSKNNSTNMDRDAIMDKFNVELNELITSAVSKAQMSFDTETERSCYIPEIKLNVRKSIEPPIRFTQHLLKNNFEDELNDLLKKYRLNNAQNKLLESIQTEFDQNKSLSLDDLKNRIENLFQSAIEQLKKDFESSCETEEMIKEKILKFYNGELNCRQGKTSKESIYNLLSIIPNMEQYQKNFQKFEFCFLQVGQQQNSQHMEKPLSSWKRFISYFKGSSDSYIDSLWKELKSKLKWFKYERNEQRCKKLFEEIWSSINQQLEAFSQLTATTKSFPSNPETIKYLFQYIENIMNSQCTINNSEILLRHNICFDLAGIGLRIIMDQAINAEKSNYQSNLENSTKEMMECKANLLSQCTAMNNAFESGRALAGTIGHEITNGISNILQNKIEKEVKEDIVKCQFINHDRVQNQIYYESFMEGNGMNIIKYAYDINRYFIELSLKEIQRTFGAIMHKHTSHFEEIIVLTINRINDCVQKTTFKDTWELRDDIRKEILKIPELNLEKSSDTQLFEVFSFNNILRIPITQANEFKSGFKDILNFRAEIKNNTDSLLTKMKPKLFESCKKAITQKLGCQVRCPGCGAKCSKTEPHEEEAVEVWQDPCEKCPQGKCTCEHPQPISMITHEATHHIAGAFHGWRYHKLHTPYLELCYQRWMTGGIYIRKKQTNNNTTSEESEDDDNNYELVFPKAKYFNIYHPAWYNDLKKQATTDVACTESIPPPEQRRSWMIVRPTLLNHYKNAMVDQKEYDPKLYPEKVDALPTDFEPKWNDESFEFTDYID